MLDYTHCDEARARQMTDTWIHEAYTLRGTWSKVKECVGRNMQEHAGHVPSGVPCDTHSCGCGFEQDG